MELNEFSEPLKVNFLRGSIPLKNFLFNGKHFHCYCHATWLPCKTSKNNKKEEGEREKKITEASALACLLQAIALAF